VCVTITISVRIAGAGCKENEAREEIEKVCEEDAEDQQRL
jgi:hypothetical protein